MYGAEYGWALGSILVFSCSGSLGRPTAGQPEPTSQASQNKTETNSNQVAKETQVKLNCAAMMLFLPCISLYFSQSISITNFFYNSLLLSEDHMRMVWLPSTGLFHLVMTVIIGKIHSYIYSLYNGISISNTGISMMTRSDFPNPIRHFKSFLKK